MPILADFRCETHGVFEQVAESDADAVECPECGSISPWTPSVVFGRVQEGSVVQGKVAPKPHPMSMNLLELGEGRPRNDWKKERRAMWREHDYKRRKSEGRIP